ncbi:uncharacterized protein LOC141728587 [Zonotrichia albicollis]|uniref:uncharacterized protein LOC141728587 n=1 Tax=Zonotrichia albicollis TaxID=44394 RepID=UPI003D80D511
MLPEDGSMNERASAGNPRAPGERGHPRPAPPPAGRSGHGGSRRGLPGIGSGPGSPRARPARAPAPLRRGPRPPPGAAAARGRRVGRQQPPGVSRAPGRARRCCARRRLRGVRGRNPGTAPSPAPPPWGDGWQATPLQPVLSARLVSRQMPAVGDARGSAGSCGYENLRAQGRSIEDAEEPSRVKGIEFSESFTEAKHFRRN